jgi:hypothetical protein
MRKWLIALAAIAALSLACVPLALAAGHPNKGHMKGHAKFQCQATIAAPADLSGLTATPTPTPALLSVNVKSGSKTIKVFRGQKTPLIVQVAANARLIDATVDPAVPLDLSTLIAGDKVHLGGTIDRGATPTDPTTWTITVTKLILQHVPAVQ